MQGHPEPECSHLGHALEEAGLRGAESSNFEARPIQVATLSFSLWLGDMPAILKGFFEQIARPGFAFSKNADNPIMNKGLKGRSACVLVIMVMSASLYRWPFRAHSVKSLERGILRFIRMEPVKTTLIGLAGNLKQAQAPN
jgi:putative NADPH-quinone reductase